MTSSHEPIHSGHFMTSNPHNDELAPDEEDEDVEVDVVDDEEDRLAAEDGVEDRRALKNQDEKPVTFYKFGPKKTQSIAIDVSLNKLNKCIKVAYNKMTTPKWKDFKGLRLDWKQRIRLNNVIWRAYYMEFRKPDKNKAKKTPYCYFAVPDDDTTHTKIEVGSVMEGMYWKRKMEAVCAQYKRWRYFTKIRKRERKRGNSCSGEIGGVPKIPPRSQTPKNTSSEYFDIDDYDNEFTDTLFDSLSQPYMFPNPKEMVQSCNADVMQPGLLSLQPSIEEIMASLDPPPDPPQACADPIPPPSASSSYSSKEYDAANLLIDYGNQTQPTRQSSMVASQALMVNSCAPTHSQATYERGIPPVLTVSFSDSSNLDYVPQFLTTTTIPPTSTVLTNRSWFMNFPSTPTPSLLSSPSTAASSPLMHSPSNATNQTNNSNNNPLLLPSSSSTLLTTTISNNDNSNLMLRSNTPSKGALKAYPSTLQPQKLTDRWTSMANNSAASTSILGTNNSGSIDNTLDMTTNALRVQQPWKLSSTSSSCLPSPLPASLSASLSSTSFSSPATPLASSATTIINPNTSRSLPIPQPLYPQLSTHITPSSSSSLSLSPSSLTSPSNHNSNIISSLEQAHSLNSNLLTSFVKEENDGNKTNETRRQQRSSLKLCDPLRNAIFNEHHSTATSSVEQSRRLQANLAGGDSNEHLSRKRSPRSAAADSTIEPVERKRILHLNAEQNRRCALKDGFEQLLGLLPNVYAAGTKPTNAVVLAKGAERIRDLKTSISRNNEKVDELRQQIQRLNDKIASLQASLPSSSRGTTTTISQRTLVEQFFERYVKDRSRQDFRFWLMTKMMRPLMESLWECISENGACREDVVSSANEWLTNNWHPSSMRPLASKMLIYLATNTAMLTNPSSLQEHIQKEISKQ